MGLRGGKDSAAHGRRRMRRDSITELSVRARARPAPGRCDNPRGRIRTILRKNGIAIANLIDRRGVCALTSLTLLSISR